MRTKPAMHEDFEINQRVIFDIDGSKELKGTGTIIGLATEHIFNTYIILLDLPMLVPEHKAPWRAIVVSGCSMKLIPEITVNKINMEDVLK